MNKKATLLLVLIFLIASCTITPLPATAASKTIIVPDDYATIEDAVTNAVQGDIVFVKKGAYYETLKIEKSISLVGEDRDATIIEGILREGVRVPLTIRQSNVSVTGFTLRGGYAGIQLHGNFSSISGNRITDTQHGIILTFGSHNNITANIIESVKYSGIWLALASSNLIQKNQAFSVAEGIRIMQSSHYNTLSENKLTNCRDCGIRLSDSDGNTLIGNNIANSGIGAIIYVANGSNIYHNNFVDNTEQVSADEWYAKTFGYAGSTNTLNENFWSDYESKYPNAKEVDASGIGNTPYAINENNTDYRPLMRQIDISAPVPTPTPTPTLTPTPTTFTVEPLWIAVPIVSVAAVAALVYLWKRKAQLSKG